MLKFIWDHKTDTKKFGHHKCVKRQSPCLLFIKEVPRTEPSWRYGNGATPHAMTALPQPSGSMADDKGWKRWLSLTPTNELPKKNSRSMRLGGGRKWRKTKATLIKPHAASNLWDLETLSMSRTRNHRAGTQRRESSKSAVNGHTSLKQMAENTWKTGGSSSTVRGRTYLMTESPGLWRPHRTSPVKTNPDIQSERTPANGYAFKPELDQDAQFLWTPNLGEVT